MKIDKLNEYIFVIALVTLAFFDFIVPNQIFSRVQLAVILAIYTIICSKFVKSKRVNSTSKNYITSLMFIFAIVYVLFLYIMGIYSGFYKNSLSFGFNVIFSRIIPYVTLIICSEILRKKFLLKERKLSICLSTIALILLDISIYNNFNSLNNLEDYLTFSGYIVMSSISINLLCNYLVKRYGMVPNILYRIIVVSYMYIFPILPDIYLFFHSTLRIIYPYFIYLILELSAKENIEKSLKKSKFDIFSLIPYVCIILMIIFVMLVSCKFKYGIIAIGSSSMSKEINKGDAIVFVQYENQKIEEGQIIVFKREGTRIVHRVVEKSYMNGIEIYHTKGDANQQRDDGYVLKEDIEGIVIYRIHNIGWPVVWLNDKY